MTAGKVFLVGAGPGDPGLITLKGLECLAQADVVIYDRLVNEALLARAKSGAELFYVGKSAQKPTVPQEEIEHFMVAKAKEGKTVARLKGGDPFLFGRGGEEAEALAEAGIPFEVVPGVTSAVAVPAYAGIPVTHRRFTSSLGIFTGHEEPSKEASSLAWDKIATGLGTLVFLMGVENLAAIAAQLVKHGRSPETPAAVIQRGTEASQRTVVGNLGNIADLVAKANLQPPAVLIVGEVVSLRERLRWFDQRPLFGLRVLVTRTQKQAGRLSQLLAAEGAEPIELPTIEILPPSDYGPLDQALAQLSHYDWIILTSVNGVESFFQRLRALGKDARELKGVKICALGAATAEALAGFGLRADLVPPDYSSQGVLAAFREQGFRRGRLLLPRSILADETLSRGLGQLGAEVEEVVAYRTVPAARASAQAQELLRQGQVPIVTFTSSSTVRGLVSLLDNKIEWLQKVTIACIGPVTGKTVEALGLKVHVMAKEHTIPGLVRALVEEYHAPQGKS